MTSPTSPTEEEDVKTRIREFIEWLIKNKKKVTVGVIVSVISGLIYGSCLTEEITKKEAEDQAVALEEELRTERIQENRRIILDLCSRINTLPVRIAETLALVAKRQELLGPTTTLPVDDLPPEVQQEIIELTREIQIHLRDLGSPIDCVPTEPLPATTVPEQGD